MVKGSAGGKATAVILRARAVSRYYENPNLCLYCGSVIELPASLRVAEAKAKKFCNQSCSAKYNNTNKGKRLYVPKRYPCLKCGKQRLLKKKTDVCRACSVDSARERSKGALLSKLPYQQYRTTIQRDARRVYLQSDKPKQCFCGYSHWFDVAHIRPVSSFGDDATIKEINAVSNLVALCPNHHWEFDNGILIFSGELLVTV